MESKEKRRKKIKRKKRLLRRPIKAILDSFIGKNDLNDKYFFNVNKNVVFCNKI